MPASINSGIEVSQFLLISGGRREQSMLERNAVFVHAKKIDAPNVTQTLVSLVATTHDMLLKQLMKHRNCLSPNNFTNGLRYGVLWQDFIQLYSHLLQHAKTLGE